VFYFIFLNWKHFAQINTFISFVRIELHVVYDRKKEKNSKFFSGIKGKKNKIHLQSQPVERHFELIDIIRSQMQASISEYYCL